MDGKTVKVHRLIALAFIENPQGKPMVNHLDNDPKNNRVENLEWATSKENMAHSVRQGRQVHQDGEKCWKHVLKAEDVKRIFSFQMKHPTMRQLPMARELQAEFPQVKVDSIRDILKGKCWKSLRSEFCQAKPPTT